MKLELPPQPSFGLPAASAREAIASATRRTIALPMAIPRLIFYRSLLSAPPRRHLRLGTVEYVWRWLSADPREVVDLAGGRTLADGARERDLGEELRRWRGIVARRRPIALARRHAAVALGLAALLEVLALLDVFPQWVVVAVPLAYFVVAVAIFAFQGPSPFGLARLLDDKLGLNDRLAAGPEIRGRGGQESSLERRTVADAAALLGAGRGGWGGG